MYLKRYQDTEKDPIPNFFIILGIVLLCMVFSQIIGAIALILIGGISFKDMGDLTGALRSSNFGWWALLVSQGISSAITFVASVMIYWRFIEKKPLSAFNFRVLPSLFLIILLILAQLSFLPLNGYFMELNEAIKLPESLSGLEKFMKNMEESMAELTKLMTTFDSNIKLIGGILVIAVIAGIGEELLFRGLIQRKIMQLAKNPHVAIWITAFIFSAIHMQFYGLIPRMLLGAFLGYVYYWSGNIWVPIIGHIFNNAFAIIMLHLVNLKKVSPEIEKLDKVPVQYLALSTVLFIGLTYLFRKKLLENEEKIFS